jgi:hypothetical protein
VQACDELEALAHVKTVSDGKLCRCSSIGALEGREDDAVLSENHISPRKSDETPGDDEPKVLKCGCERNR